MTVGARIRNLREVNEIPQNMLAEWLHVSHGTLKKIEDGFREPFPHEIAEIAKIFRITEDEVRYGVALPKTRISPDRLRALRRGRHMTLRDLAEQCGVHQETIGKWERGDLSPTEANLKRTAEALGVTPEDLCGGPKWRRY